MSFREMLSFNDLVGRGCLARAIASKSVSRFGINGAKIEWC